MTLWLIGMMGSGKTTAGRLAAGSLGVGFHDTDDEVASGLGCSVAELWNEVGEYGFRVLESAAVQQLAGAVAIISTGGGAVVDKANRERMKATGPVVWLRARPEVLASRLVGAGRPLLNSSPDRTATLTALLIDRSRTYFETADFEIDTSSLSVEDVASKIEGLWPS
jgi:shikimate kinase